MHSIIGKGPDANDCGERFPTPAICKQRLVDHGFAADVVEAVLPVIKVGADLHKML
jgi:hypothetical protein